jgi:hypothetical protein
LASLLLHNLPSWLFLGCLISCVDAAVLLLQAVGQLTYIRPYVTDFSPEWLFSSSLALVAGALSLIYVAGAQQQQQQQQLGVQEREEGAAGGQAAAAQRRNSGSGCSSWYCACYLMVAHMAAA